MVLQHGAGDPKLSCSEYAGPKGEGKHRQDQRQNMFTSNADRFAVKKTDEYKAKLGPGSYPGAKERIVAWGNWDHGRRLFDVHRHGFRWESNRQRFDKNDAVETARPNVNPLNGDHWDNTLNIRIGKAERFPQPKSEEYKKKIGPGTYEVHLAHNRLLNHGRAANRQGSAFKRPVGVPRVERSVRHGDPAELGPGTYDAETPDEVQTRKHQLRSDPTTAAFEIQTAPRIPRELRHGDPKSLGPGTYDWAQRPKTAEERTRPSSAFAGPGRGADSYAAAHVGAAVNVETAWNMDRDARTWLVGGDAGVTAGSFSSCDRFETPHTVPAWRSEYTSRQRVLAAIARHEALKAKDKRDRRRKRKKKWIPETDS